MTPDQENDAALEAVLGAFNFEIKDFNPEGRKKLREAMRKVRDDSYMQGAEDAHGLKIDDFLNRIAAE